METPALEQLRIIQKTGIDTTVQLYNIYTLLSLLVNDCM